MKKYIVLYESYTEYNQFEGSWDLQKDEFHYYDKAEKRYLELKNSDGFKYKEVKNIHILTRNI